VQGADCLHIVQLMPLSSPNPIISCGSAVMTQFMVPFLGDKKVWMLTELK